MKKLSTLLIAVAISLFASAAKAAVVVGPIDYIRNLGYNTLAIGTNTSTANRLIEDRDGDLWILANASYTHSTGQFNRIDITKPAWGIEMIGRGLFPGEVDSGWVVWKCSAGANPIGSTFGAVGGWELGFDVTSNRDLVVGGSALEMDGHGTFPFGRLLHSSFASGGTHYTGVGRNIYDDFLARDSNSYPVYFSGFKGDNFVVSLGTTGAGALLAEMMVVSTNAAVITKPSYTSIYSLRFPDGTTQTTAGGGGGGDAYLASTQTWSGVNTFVSTQSVRLVPTRTSGTNANTSGAMLIDNTRNDSGFGLQIFSDAQTQAVGNAHLFLLSNSTSYNTPMLWIKSNSTSTIGGNADILVHANNPDIEFRELDKYDVSNGNGQYEIAVNDDDLQMNFRNVTNTAFQSQVTFNRNQGMKFKELDNGGDFMSFKATTTMPGASYTIVLPPVAPSLNEIFKITSTSGTDFNAEWVAESGGGGVTVYAATSTASFPFGASFSTASFATDIVNVTSDGRITSTYNPPFLSGSAPIELTSDFLGGPALNLTDTDAWPSGGGQLFRVNLRDSFGTLYPRNISFSDGNNSDGNSEARIYLTAYSAYLGILDQYVTTKAQLLFGDSSKTNVEMDFIAGSSSGTINWNSVSAQFSINDPIIVVGSVTSQGIVNTGPGNFTASAISNVPVKAKGTVGQTANILEAQDSSANVLVRVTPAGLVGINSTTPPAYLSVNGSTPTGVATTPGTPGTMIVSLIGEAGSSSNVNGATAVGGIGSSGTVVTGNGGIATQANARTGGRGGPFNFNLGIGGLVTGSTQTVTSGLGGDFTVSAGTSGAATSSSSGVPTVAQGGSIYHLGGPSGALSAGSAGGTQGPGGDVYNIGGSPAAVSGSGGTITSGRGGNVINQGGSPGVNGASAAGGGKGGSILNIGGTGATWSTLTGGVGGDIISIAGKGGGPGSSGGGVGGIHSGIGGTGGTAATGAAGGFNMQKGGPGGLPFSSGSGGAGGWMGLFGGDGGASGSSASSAAGSSATIKAGNGGAASGASSGGVGGSVYIQNGLGGVGTSNSGLAGGIEMQTTTGTVYENRFNLNALGAYDIRVGSFTAGSPTGFNIKFGTHTGLAANTEAIDLRINMNRNVRFAGGTIPLQRSFVVDAASYSAVGATVNTISTAATLSISGPPVAGSSTTIQNPLALFVEQGKTQLNGNVSVSSVGAVISISTGSNATAGTAVMVGGTVVVNTTKVTNNSMIFLTSQNLGTVTVGQGLTVSARTAGASFTILSGSAIDTSTVGWWILEPN